MLEVKRLKLPELTEEFLQEMGGFESEEKLREAIQADLGSGSWSTNSSRKSAARLPLLTESADWELPPGLLKRQSGTRSGTGCDGTSSGRIQRSRDSRP